MKRQWDHPPHPNPNRSADAEVARDLDRHLARQDRADERAEEVERMAGEVLADSDHYDGLLERLAADPSARIAAFQIVQAETLTGMRRASLKLRRALKEAAHAYADENLEKLLEGGL